MGWGSAHHRGVITAPHLVFPWNSQEKLTHLIWSSPKVIREKLMAWLHICFTSVCNQARNPSGQPPPHPHLATCFTNTGIARNRTGWIPCLLLNSEDRNTVKLKCAYAQHSRGKGVWLQMWLGVSHSWNTAFSVLEEYWLSGTFCHFGMTKFSFSLSFGRLHTTYISINLLLLKRAPKLSQHFCREEMPQGVYLDKLKEK